MKAVVPLLATLVLVPALVGCDANDYGGPPPEVPLPSGVYPESVTYGDSPEVPIGAAEAEYEDTDPSALTDFRGVLAPYGDWVDDRTYGTVWIPSTRVVGRDFVPYSTAGHWVYSDEYIWVSDYPWGWVPFHYGRWVYIAGRGWAWIPGRRYAGAWVTWRTGGAMYDYVGWAPLPPSWIWNNGFAVGLGVVPPPRYVYCAARDVFAPVIATRIIRDHRVPVIASRTTPYIPAGPVVVGAPARPVGPPPARLNISPARIARPTGRDVGLARAEQFARPVTAVPLGARAPAGRPQVNPGLSARPIPTPIAQSSPTVPRPPPVSVPGRAGSTPLPGPAYPPPMAPAPAPAIPHPVPVQPMPQVPPPMAPAPRFTPPPAPPPPVAPPPVAPGAPHMPFPNR
jgi:hypothetical protein